MSEVRVGGMVSIVRWCKEVKRNGNFERALLFTGVILA